MKFYIICLIFLALISTARSQEEPQFVSFGDMQEAIQACTDFYCIGFACLDGEEVALRDSIQAGPYCERFGKAQGLQSNQDSDTILSLEFVVSGLKCVTRIRDELTSNFYGRSRYQCCIDIFHKAQAINENYLDTIFG